jgi:hypothetical protein
MAGVDSAGLGEVLQGILARFSEAEKARLVKVCFVFFTFQLQLIQSIECIHYWRSIAVSWSSRKTSWDTSSDFAA